MFVCAGNGEEFEFAKSIGVGLVESAMTLSQLCSCKNIESLVFIGSAGSYDKEVKLLDLFVSDYATQIENSFLQDKSYTPIPQEIKLTQNVSCETIQKIFSLDLPQAIVNSSNYICVDSNYALNMKKKGILLENMEFFSVLSVARRFNLPALGVFCVSNYCGENAHQEFLKNRGKVIEKLKSVVERLKV
ncbi:purine-nucleoside phosphorylase [Helicobacter cholecystus]|uniref:Purine-nucleoside phosphorylase n=1 Tax=Helicobacter cholecystus TaxID=45498 RepID=A0A3D8IYQ5_9HELI|nr:purine-nucleoside phosphorylase [Helicobacter cholecystus]RDU70183.1 purine-nucleoside phosphorylase [Helicobacter cholecystus]VEJ24792.1 purine nucleoside phosphorylase [Helicobacter cholecystus]